MCYNLGDFEFLIMVLQFNLVKYFCGYISFSLWDVGVLVGFLDYNSNVYGVFNGNRDDGLKLNFYNVNIGLIIGFNFGEWWLRKCFNICWNNDGGV